MYFAGTYRRKAKRDLEASPSYAAAAITGVDVLKAQEMILKEMGPDACVYEKVCAAYAEAKKNRDKGRGKDRMDWEKIIRWVVRQAREIGE